MQISGNSVGVLFEGLTLLHIKLLPITTAHLLALETLPPLHKDPFDRILPAQSLVEGLPLVTVDRTLQQYGIATVWDV